MFIVTMQDTETAELLQIGTVNVTENGGIQVEINAGTTKKHKKEIAILLIDLFIEKRKTTSNS